MRVLWRLRVFSRASAEAARRRRFEDSFAGRYSCEGAWGATGVFAPSDCVAYFGLPGRLSEMAHGGSQGASGALLDTFVTLLALTVQDGRP